MDNNSKTYKLPGGWIEVELAEILIDAKNHMVDGPFGSNLKASEYKSEGVPVIRIQNIDRNKFLDKNIKYVTEEKAEFLSRHSFESGDIIVTKLGEPVGKACIMPLLYKKGIIVADLVRIRVDERFISSQYLTYQINSHDLIKQFSSKAKGTTRQRVNLTIMRSLKIKLPPFNEQKRIVKRIESLFSELGNAKKEFQKAKHQLAVYRQALLKNAFNGKLTEQWRQEKITNISRPKDYAIPDEWEFTKIESISSFTGSGSTPRGGRNVYQEKGIPFIRSQNIYPNNFIQDDLVFISESINLKMKRTQTKPKDVLINITGASIGRCAYIPENFKEGNVNQHVCIIRTIPEIINYKYLTYILNSPEIQSLIIRINSGATREALNLSQIRNIEIPICSIREQEQIVFHLESKFTLIKNIEDSIKEGLLNLEKLYHSILNEAFNGKLAPQDVYEESAINLLNQIKIEKTLYLKKIKSQKMKTSSENKSNKKKKTLLELLKEEYTDTEFTFEDIRRLSNKTYEDLKSELYLLLDKESELEIVFNKSVKKIQYKIKS